MNQVLFKKLINISAPILITGETGTGKSKAARRLFDLSSVHKVKFLTLHLASLKEDLIESELFGHKKGSFTGAIENKSGYLADAGKGTLFLDEIGELSLEAQKKLLYLLEEKKYTPVGSTAAAPFEGRLILATNKNLRAMVAEGKFREDLFYRLNIFHLKLEPLSKSKEKLHRDILRVFDALKIQYQRPSLSLSAELIHVLMSSPWKGNYRELKNCLEFMVAMSESQALTPASLPDWFNSDSDPGRGTSEDSFIAHFPADFNQALERFEEWYLKAMLERKKGKVNETARLLGMSKTTLISRAKKYGIDTLMMRAEAGRQNALKLAA